METISLEFPARAPATGCAYVGVVGSGDLEVLAEPGTTGKTHITIKTSVDGSAPIWRAQLERMFAAGELPAVTIEINDFGATPGVVHMRIAQAMEEIAHV